MYSWDNAQVVLVGNKCDLEQDRAVTEERGQRLADQLGNFFHFMDVRACSSWAFCFLEYCQCCLVCLMFFKGYYR